MRLSARLAVMAAFAFAAVAPAALATEAKQNSRAERSPPGASKTRTVCVEKRSGTVFYKRRRSCPDGYFRVLLRGPRGPIGSPGRSGPAGADGPAGPAGAPGISGSFGPPCLGWCPPGGSAAGADGTGGTDGYSVLSGSSDPIAEQGNDGDFFVNTTTWEIFGPKAEGNWPMPGTSLIGPKGDEGPAGPQGDAGPKGDEGPAGPQGDPGPKGDNGAVGPKGDPGPAGPIEGLSWQTGSAPAVGLTNTSAVATCPAGAVAIGGGGTLSGNAIRLSYPSNSAGTATQSRPTSWTIVSSSAGGSATAYAVCATAPSP